MRASLRGPRSARAARWAIASRSCGSRRRRVGDGVVEARLRSSAAGHLVDSELRAQHDVERLRVDALVAGDHQLGQHAPARDASWASAARSRRLASGIWRCSMREPPRRPGCTRSVSRSTRLSSRAHLLGAPARTAPSSGRAGGRPRPGARRSAEAPRAPQHMDPERAQQPVRTNTGASCDSRSAASGETLSDSPQGSAPRSPTRAPCRSPSLSPVRRSPSGRCRRAPPATPPPLAEPRAAAPGGCRCTPAHLARIKATPQAVAAAAAAPTATAAPLQAVIVLDIEPRSGVEATPAEASDHPVRAAASGRRGAVVRLGRRRAAAPAAQVGLDLSAGRAAPRAAPAARPPRRGRPSRPAARRRRRPRPDRTASTRSGSGSLVTPAWYSSLRQPKQGRSVE